MSWTPLEIEEEEIDKEAKKLEEQKRANADEVITDENFHYRRKWIHSKKFAKFVFNDCCL